MLLPDLELKEGSKFLLEMVLQPCYNETCVQLRGLRSCHTYMYWLFIKLLGSYTKKVFKKKDLYL